jgi:GDSL-like Lipase/Acylhydrolase family
MASTGFTGPAEGSTALNGSVVSFDHGAASAIGSMNYWTDVTSMLKPAVDAAAAGSVSLSWHEENSSSIDGAILILIYDDPGQQVDRTVSLLFGGMQPGGDEFKVALTKPFDPTIPNAVLQMSLGISYSYQTGGEQQYSTVDVNGRRLTTSAGGEDDGEPSNGALITVGGVGDSPDNPVEPNATPTNPRSDDELYDLRPFVPSGGSTIDITTTNPSADDNIFFVSFLTNPPTSSVTAGNPSSTRYVALGDSVPYGHGLSNPYPTPQVGLASDATGQGPSSVAYPDLVAQTLDLSMRLRSSNCTVTGDELAISGANASTTNVRPRNDQCSSWNDSQSVERDELPAADLSTFPAQLVTIQAGADDINFGGCLQYEIAKYGPFHLGTSCVNGGSVTSTVAGKLGNVRGALANEIKTVSPHAKEVLVLNYYQIIPDPADFKQSSIFPDKMVNPICWALSHNPAAAWDDANVIQSALNGAIARAVNDAQVAGVTNVKLLDISNLEQHHEMCTGNPALFSGEPMEKSTFYSNIASKNTANIKRYVWRAGHPNSFGQNDIAQRVIGAAQ